MASDTAEAGKGWASGMSSRRAQCGGMAAGARSEVTGAGGISSEEREEQDHLRLAHLGSAASCEKTKEKRIAAGTLTPGLWSLLGTPSRRLGSFEHTGLDKTLAFGLWKFDLIAL